MDWNQKFPTLSSSIPLKKKLFFSSVTSNMQMKISQSNLSSFIQIIYAWKNVTFHHMCVRENWFHLFLSHFFFAVIFITIKQLSMWVRDEKNKINYKLFNLFIRSSSSREGEKNSVRFLYSSHSLSLIRFKLIQNLINLISSFPSVYVCNIHT